MDSTRVLADHVAGLDFRTMPAAVLDQAKRVLADTVSVLLSASREPAVRLALRTFGHNEGRCTVVGHERRLGPETAAFVNGVGGHDIELDDVHTSTRTHPAAVLVPAALAAAELAGDCSGGTLLAGIVAGYDVQARVGKAMGVQRAVDRGFHPTAVCGTVGAAVCAGKILALPAERLVSCVALAGSQCAGLKIYHGESSHLHKSMQVGAAARNGVYAAMLARNGYPGAPAPLTGRHNMLTPFGGPEPDFPELTRDLGTRFEIHETTIKRHACCAQTHSAIDALLSLLGRHGVEPAEIRQIDVRLAHDALAVVDRSPLWTHNIQYVLAIAATTGHVERAHFGGQWTRDPQVAALADRVVAKGSDDLQRDFPTKPGATVELTTTRGTFTETCPVPHGSPLEPLTDRELRDKFSTLASQVLDENHEQSLWEFLANCESTARTDDLFGLIAAPDR